MDKSRAPSLAIILADKASKRDRSKAEKQREKLFDDMAREFVSAVKEENYKQLAGILKAISG